MMSQWDRVESRLGESALDRLGRSKVAIVGLGSLGSQTAVLLASAGVGEFVLIDPDVLEENNVVRHAADLTYVGQPKVMAVADLIEKRNPKAIVLPIQDRAQNHREELSNVTLAVVAGLGSEIAQRQMGQLLRELAVPFLVGGVYEKGVGGEVFFVAPESGPCYACFASKLRDSEPVVDVNVDYGMDPQEVRAQPGLGVHVARVAVAAADWALRLIIANTDILKNLPGNLLIVANDEMEIGSDSKGNPVVLQSGMGKWLQIKRIQSCLVCSLPDPVRSNTLSIDQLLTKGDDDHE